ncbi:MAG: carboxypeptidase-like regulatory domain-containing protein, partial [Gemmatimonadetes bacterium]|nr:carboxypeptidase-like regulatory domain-containing protein [Gemmatimonadota bacterium]
MTTTMRNTNVMRALLLTVCMAIPGVLGAQENEVPRVTIEGEVLDLVTGVPVPVAIIGVPGIDRTAISDEWGYFKLEEVPVGTYVLQVMRIGYETLGAE